MFQDQRDEIDHLRKVLRDTGELIIASRRAIAESLELLARVDRAMEVGVITRP